MVLAVSSGCLLLGEPDFSPPQRTQPIVRAINPPAHALLRIDEAPTFVPQEFSVQIVSEDAETTMQGVLLLDYGVSLELGDGTQPYQQQLNSTAPITPGTLLDLGREESLVWQPPSAGEPECHTITFQVHRTNYDEAPYKWCPADDPTTQENEAPHFSRVTWQVLLCPTDVMECQTSLCPTTPPDDGCPTDLVKGALAP